MGELFLCFREGGISVEGRNRFPEGIEGNPDGGVRGFSLNQTNLAKGLPEEILSSRHFNGPLRG